jgi:hypothetical protein
MTTTVSSQIMERSLDITIGRGFKPRDIDRNRDHANQCRGKMTSMVNNMVRFEHGAADFHAIIFNWRFAIYLWGKHYVSQNTGYPEEHYTAKRWINIPKIENWKYHLQHMVIAPDPLVSLGKHMHDKTY